jgi:hypothetical protein
MMESGQRHSRNRALWLVRLVTAGSVGAALGLTWAFAGLAEAFFSGKPPAPAPPPQVPVAAVPVQKPRPVVVTVVQHPYQPQAPSRSAAPQPPAKAPVAAPAPPPPPVCHSTPSKPC